MKCLTREDAVAWMVRHLPEGTLLQQGTDLPRLSPTDYECVHLAFPSDSGRRVYLAHVALECFKDEPHLLVHLLNWDIFASAGHVPLLLRLRQALGESRPLAECPGHLFSDHERADAASVAVLSLLFFWDCLIVGESGRVIFHMSHDECCDLMSATQATTTYFKKMTEGMT